MAIDRVSKFVIAIHQSIERDFLARLQRLGIFHITRRESLEGQQPDRDFVRLLETIEILNLAAGRRMSGRVNISRQEYEQIASTYDPQPLVARVEFLIQRKNELYARERELMTEITRLVPWRNLQLSPAERIKFTYTRFVFARFPDSSMFETVRGQLLDKPVILQVVNEQEDGVRVLIIFPQAYEPELMEIMAKVNWVNEDLGELSQSPAAAVEGLMLERSRVRAELENIQRELEQLAKELPKLKVKANELLNFIKRREIGNHVRRTDTVILIYGWIRNRDITKLQRLVEESGPAALMPVEKDPQEQPPVALINPRLWRPFELVLELYQLPVPEELDPTWLVAPFFAVFFGLCITDAGYGLVLALLTLLLMRRLGFSNKLLGMIFAGAVFTVPAGAMMGGWFGDLPERLGLRWLVLLKNWLMWFDPMKEPLKFFILSVALGYIQLNAGILLEVADCLRQRKFGDGLLKQLPWFLFLNGIVLRVVAGRTLSPPINILLVTMTALAVAAIVVFTQMERATLFSQWLWFGLLSALFIYLAQKLNWLRVEITIVRWLLWAIFAAMLAYAALTIFRCRCWNVKKIVLALITLGAWSFFFARIIPSFLPAILTIIFYFSAPSGQRLLAKFAWGGYALYSATSYIGVVLSYIRLMALGMCTGGVAMAINVIAWMLMPMPLIGPVLALIVLVIGHGYNIVVNVLGAFVHSLRLQYVEFFPRFYTGGGEPFQPFREINEFVVMKSYKEV